MNILCTQFIHIRNTYKYVDFSEKPNVQENCVFIKYSDSKKFMRRAPLKQLIRVHFTGIGIIVIKRN